MRTRGSYCSVISALTWMKCIPEWPVPHTLLLSETSLISCPSNSRTMRGQSLSLLVRLCKTSAVTLCRLSHLLTMSCRRYKLIRQWNKRFRFFPYLPGLRRSRFFLFTKYITCFCFVFKYVQIRSMVCAQFYFQYSVKEILISKKTSLENRFV